MEKKCVECSIIVFKGSRCDNCRKKQNERSKRLYERRKAAKECFRCGKPRQTEAICCDICSDLNRSSKKSKRDTWKNDGLCTKCGSQRDTDGLLCINCLEERRLKHKTLKQKVIDAYGGKCQCSGCGDKFIGRLTIDHIDNNGADHRRQLKTKGGDTIYRFLVKNKFPPGYQVLCGSCNLCKQTTGYCPHGEEYYAK